MSLKILDSFSNNKYLGNESITEKILDNTEVMLINAPTNMQSNNIDILDILSPKS